MVGPEAVAEGRQAEPAPAAGSRLLDRPLVDLLDDLAVADGLGVELLQEPGDARDLLADLLPEPVVDLDGLGQQLPAPAGRRLPGAVLAPDALQGVLRRED